MKNPLSLSISWCNLNNGDIRLHLRKMGKLLINIISPYLDEMVRVWTFFHRLMIFQVWKAHIKFNLNIPSPQHLTQSLFLSTCKQ